jgi:hypothetical protein
MVFLVIVFWYDLRVEMMEDIVKNDFFDPAVFVMMSRITKRKMQTSFVAVVQKFRNWILLIGRKNRSIAFP